MSSTAVYAACNEGTTKPASGANTRCAWQTSAREPPAVELPPCFSAGTTMTVKIFGGTQTFFDRAASIYQVCNGFGAPESFHLTLTPSQQCAIIAAAAVFVPGSVRGPVIREGVKWACNAADVYESYQSGNWLGLGRSKGCDYFGGIFAGAAGIFVAGETANPVLGVRTWRALKASLKLVCGGALQTIGRDLGYKLEADHETHIMLDVVHRGKCITLVTRFGVLQWGAIDCKS